MSGGLLDYLTEAAHISAGIGCTFREAQGMTVGSWGPNVRIQGNGI
jgi:hypothetical protein